MHTAIHCIIHGDDAKHSLVEWGLVEHRMVWAR
jgi:hypothetical protein